MSDNLSPENRKKTMRAVKGKGTTLERRLFSMLVRMGLSNWEKNSAQMIGKPDVVFPKERVAIFVDGCFWHGCPYCNRKLPQTNRAYWQSKIERNKKLAQKYNKQLRKKGWIVIRIWEHEMQDATNRQKIKVKIRAAVIGALK